MVFKLLRGLFGQHRAASHDVEANDQMVATAALLIEAASMDGAFDAGERTVLLHLLRSRFLLSEPEAEDLLAAAEQQHGASDRVFKFALTARNAFSEPEREELLEMLWVTVLSDGRVHDYEANLMRRIAGLLHVPDRLAGEARKRALARAHRPPQGGQA